MYRMILVLTCLMAAVTSPASAVELYGCDDTSLWSVNPLNGGAMLIGVLDPPVTGLLGGLEMADGVLYGLAGTPGNALWRVDPATAGTTMIGTGLGVGLIFEGGLAFDGQDLWGVNQGVSNAPKYLIRIDRQTGTAVVVGMLGPTGDHDFNGLAFHEGELYGIDRVTNALWKINRADPTLSYQVGPAFGGGISLGVKGGMAGEYCYADGSRQIFRVDFVSGYAQVLASSNVLYRSFAPTGDPTSVPWQGMRPRIEGIEPNPAVKGTRILLALPREARVNLAVHDVAGRLIRVLIDEARSGGTRTIVWDGRDLNGQAVPAGVYFVRGISGGFPLEGKVVVVH